MFEFWTHAALIIWSMIFSIAGVIVLLVIAGLLAHEIFMVLIPNLFRKITSKENES